MTLRKHRTSSVKASNPKQLVQLRATTTQEELAETARLSIATITRIERGQFVSGSNARAYYDALVATQCFEELFETAIQQSTGPDERPNSIDAEIRYDWDNDIIPAAQKVFEELKRFRPDVIVTFQGASSVFSGLILNMCYSREEFLRIPVYMVLFLAKTLPAALDNLPGYDRRKTRRFTLQVPKALKEYLKTDRGKRKKIALIDDTITTGASFEDLREYFSMLGYNKVFTACCVFNSTIREEIPDQPSLVPDAIGITAPHSKYKLPWGPRL